MPETTWYIVTGYYMLIAGVAGIAIGFALGRFAIGGKS